MLSLVAIHSTIQGGIRSVKERARANPVLFAATTSLVLLGLFLRARGYLFDRHGLWLDEASWALMLIRDPLITLLIRPIGFMSVNKVLALVLGPTEVVLRTLSWIAGVSVVLLAPPLSRRLFRAPVARLLFVGVLALHPAAIDLAKEFKPYSVSLCAHLSVLFLVLRYVNTQRKKDLLIALGAAFVAGLFAQDMVMAYPGAFLVLGWDTLTRRRDRLPWVLAGATAVLLLLFAQYWFIWRHLSNEEPEYWGHKYNIFYVQSGRQSHLGWWFERYKDLADFPGLRHKFWDARWVSHGKLSFLRDVDTSVWHLLHFTGIALLLVFRRFREAVLLLMPVATTSLMNTLGQWPFGMFRANLFLLGYGTAIAAMALDFRAATSTRWFVVVPTFALVLVPLVLFDHTWNARKKALCYDSDMPKMLSDLTELEPVPHRGDKKLLIISRRSCDPYEYYATLHPTTSRRYRKTLERTFDVRCYTTNPELERALPELAPADGHAWLLTDMAPQALEELEQHLRGRVTLERRAYATPFKLEELRRARQ